jgi:hypothetical protein
VLCNSSNTARRKTLEKTPDRASQADLNLHNAQRCARIVSVFPFENNVIHPDYLPPVNVNDLLVEQIALEQHRFRGRGHQRRSRPKPKPRSRCFEIANRRHRIPRLSTLLCQPEDQTKHARGILSTGQHCKLLHAA